MARRKDTKGHMLIKLDMEKAYDKMSWGSIREALCFHGAKEPLLGWIMSCIEIKRLNLMINGSREGVITPQCGLRQGDPLSPTLFILVVDLLSRLILEASETGKIEVSRCQELQILSHTLCLLTT